MTRRIAALAFLVALPSTASAQSWSDFAKAFPLLPCQDGWASCLVDSQAVTPDMVSAGGVPTPANLRVGWFDLKPTGTFSPFVSLSDYKGTEVAVADAAEVPEPAPPPEPSAEEIAAQAQAQAAADEASRTENERRAAEEASRKAAADQEMQKKAAADAAKRQAELEAQAKKSSDAAEADRLRKQAEAEAKKASEAEAARKTAELAAQKAEADRIAKVKAEEEARKKADEEAKRLATLKAEEEAKRKVAEEEARKKAEADAAAKAAAQPVPAPGSPPVADAGAADAAAVAGPASCEVTDLSKLEPQAIMGKLSLAQIKACEASLGTAPKMTDKDKISRVLMSNAFGKGDKATWEQLVKRHLDEIDQSDPDLCYKYALHLSQQGPGRASGVIRWSNVSLENRTVWTGEQYTSRVYALYKLRAAAAQQLWQKAEEENAANPTEDTRKKVDDYRNQTKVLAREWYEYAKQASKDTTVALKLCMSAAGTADYCEAN